MNQTKLLKLGVELLKQKKIEEAEIKAKRLLEFVLKQSREEFIRNSLEEVIEIQEQEYREKLDEIIQGRPLQYITHHQEFMGLDFYVNEDVLIPQPDTEILVEEAIKLIQTAQKDNSTNNFGSQNVNESQKEKGQPIQMLDLCTGSGAIAISIAKYTEREKEFQTSKNIHLKNSNNLQNEEKQKTQKVSIVASDISSKALEIAKQNAIQNQVEERIQFIQSDMFSKLIDYKFDVIVSNPPYIETNVISTLSNEVQQEPKIALDGGKDGLEFYKIILKEASNYLKNNGYVLFEIGYNQGERIFDLWEQFKCENKCELKIITKKPIKDLGGNDRVMIFQKDTK